MKPHQKESTCAGRESIVTNNKLFLATGIIGAVISLLGLSQTYPQIYYVIGSGLLLLTAIYFKIFYFIALEIILMGGHGAILLHIGPNLQFALPVLLCLQLLIFYYLSGQLNNFYIVIGIAGIAVLSVGFAYENQWVFFSGSSAVAFYAFHRSAKQSIALLWAIMNSLFALIAVAKLYIL